MIERRPANPAGWPESDLTSASGERSEQGIVVPFEKTSNRYVRVRHIKRGGQADERDATMSERLSAAAIESGEMTLPQRIKKLLIGSPIPTEEAIHERIGKFKALAVLSSDALSSVAYGTEASLAVLATAGVATLQHNLLLGISIVVLLAIVAFSYRQTIFHYPNGGGSYIVARDNLNVHFGLIAAAALLIDYILTVSVSVSAGVDNLLSAFPQIPTALALGGWSLSIRIVLGLALIVLIVLVNLRGVRESGTIFAAPTYLFVASFLLMIGVGLVRAILAGGLFHAMPPAPYPAGTDFRPTEQLSFFLILTAFASGCSAMTGVEAISNGVPIFKPRAEKNAAQTLTMMAVLLGVMYVGTTYLAWRFGLVPNQEQHPTLIAQMAHLFFTGWFGWFFYVFQIATTLILVLAANTSFSDFPRLASILARDQFLPHVFGMQGDRLAFNTGIIVLGIFSSTLLAIFTGNTDALINLYAVGVFAAFTMSQLGMVRRWLRRREPGWHAGLPINALGAVATAVVTAIIAIAKFDHGAWVVVILIPIIYGVFRAIHRHYARIKRSVAEIPVRRPGELRHIMVVPIASLDNLARRGLAYARSLTPLVIAVHVAIDDQDAATVTQQWHDLVKGGRFLRGGPIAEDNAPDDDNVSSHKEEITGPELVIIDSPYRALTRPILNYIDMLQRKYPDDIITVVLPEFVITNVWEALLHNQTAFLLKWRLLGRPQIATTNVPYHFMHEHAT